MMKEALARRAPNGSEKIAAALLKIRIGVEPGRWLIPEPLRSEGTAKEICSAIEWDHIRRHAEGGDTRPQNMDPMLKADHREKSRIDTTEVAKGKRYGAKEAAHRERLLAKGGDDSSPSFPKKSQRPKAKLRSRGFASPEERLRVKLRYGDANGQRRKT